MSGLETSLWFLHKCLYTCVIQGFCVRVDIYKCTDVYSRLNLICSKQVIIAENRRCYINIKMFIINMLITKSYVGLHNSVYTNIFYCQFFKTGVKCHLNTAPIQDRWDVTARFCEFNIWFVNRAPLEDVSGGAERVPAGAHRSDFFLQRRHDRWAASGLHGWAAKDEAGSPASRYAAVLLGVSSTPVHYSVSIMCT